MEGSCWFSEAPVRWKKVGVLGVASIFLPPGQVAGGSPHPQGKSLKTGPTGVLLGQGLPRLLETGPKLTRPSNW